MLWEFEGVFCSIGYNVNIDCTALSTEEAVDKVNNMIVNYKRVAQEMELPLSEAKKRVSSYENNICKLVESI